MEERISSCEIKISEKADKVDLVQLTSKIKNLENKLGEYSNQLLKLNHKIDLTRFEPYEKAKRVTNIVIRGIPETGSVEEDRLRVSLALAEVGCAEVLPTDVTRLGELSSETSYTSLKTDSTQGNLPYYRPIRCTLNSRQERNKVLKNGKNIRQSKLEDFDVKKVFFVPDQTPLERADDKALRDLLKSKRENYPDKKFMIKNKQVMEIATTEFTQGLSHRQASWSHKN